jgi:hypothetical protein
MLQLLLGGRLTEDLASALRRSDISVQPVFSPFVGGATLPDQLCLATSGKRLQQAATEPCAALEGKAGREWAQAVKARSLAFAQEVAAALAECLSTLDDALHASVVGGLEVHLALHAELPRSDGDSDVSSAWVQHLRTRPVFSSGADTYVRVATEACRRQAIYLCLRVLHRLQLTPKAVAFFVRRLGHANKMEKPKQEGTSGATRAKQETSKQEKPADVSSRACRISRSSNFVRTHGMRVAILLVPRPFPTPVKESCIGPQHGLRSCGRGRASWQGAPRRPCMRSPPRPKFVA